METLKAAARDMSKKGKLLRREGFLTGTIAGKDLGEPILIQIPQKDMMIFMRSHTVGGRGQVEVEGKSYPVLIKEVDFDTLANHYIDASFQQLVADEMIRSTAEIVYLNEEHAQGYATSGIKEIQYKAYPKDIVAKIEINVSDYPIGTNLTVADLEISKNPDITVLTAADDSVLHVAAHRKGRAEDEEETEEGTETAAESTDAE